MKTICRVLYPNSWILIETITIYAKVDNRWQTWSSSGNMNVFSRDVLYKRYKLIKVCEDMIGWRLEELNQSVCIPVDVLIIHCELCLHEGHSRVIILSFSCLSDSGLAGSTAAFLQMENIRGNQRCLSICWQVLQSLPDSDGSPPTLSTVHRFHFHFISDTSSLSSFCSF